MVICNYQPKADLLQGKVILITGCAEGVGKATARALAECGATVVLIDKSIPKLEELYDEIVAAGGPQPAIYPINFEGAYEKDFGELAERVTSEFSSIDGLIHSAGLIGDLTPLVHYSSEEWLKILQVNLTAPFLLTKACLPALEEAKESASVVFLSDAVGREGKAYWGAYAAAKSGLEGMMQVLADEVETEGQIRCNSFDPGTLATRMRFNAFPGELPGTWPEPETVAPALVYLMGSDSKHLNGQRLSANSLLTD